MAGADRPERRALETLHARTAADVRLASPDTDWDTVAASRFRMGRLDIDLPPLHVPLFGVNYGAPFHLERTLHGRKRSARVTPGHLAIAPPDFATRWVCDRAGDILVVFLSRDVLDGAVADGAGRDPRSVEIIPRFVIRDLVLERIAHQLLGEIARPQTATRLRVDTLAQELATHLLGAHSSLGRLPDRRLRGMAPAKLKRAKDFIHANLARDVSLAEVAAAAGMSLYHFARAFRDATGRPPHRYATEQRLLRARTLLHDPALTISAVAAAVGLTHSHFTRIFARHMAMTPSAFRELFRS